MKKTLPYISIIAISAFLGNMLVIGFGFGTYWQTLEPMAFQKQFTLQFPNLLPPTMGILLPALIATIAMIINTKGQTNTRKNWIIAFLGLFIACTITTIYHLPTNFGFMDSRYTSEEVVSKLNLWLILHWIRTFFVFISAIYSVKAFSSTQKN
ncbi:anthrone oxygenase family protein [Polaribacter sp.]|uniref:anthrone oxygenase family protein n=1 Tax=Polaribacter sp. TaxID=1920175 RepID=UPI003F6B6116